MTSGRKLVAILFTDIAGYTAIVGRDEAKGVELRDKHRRLVQTLVAQFDGRWVNETGDDSLSLFPSAVDAVHCALAIQGVLANDPQLSVRIGVHLGDVLEREDRVFGDGVNVASRLPALVDPGDVCVSQRVYEEIRNQPGLSAAPLGEKRLKNVEHPVAAYRVGRGSESLPARPRRRLAVLAAAAALALLGGWWLVTEGRAAIPLALIRAGAFKPGPEYEQEIAFTTTSDGVRIAYAVVGEGPPVVLVQGWFSHLERGMGSPGWNPFAPALMDRHRVVQFDGRGSGLSDRGVADFSLEAKLRDLDAVVAAAGLERFALFGISSGGATAIAYAARHPERVTRVAFYGAFASLAAVPEHLARWNALIPAVRVGWGEDEPAYRQIFTSLFMPDADELSIRVFNEMQRLSATPEDAAAFMESMAETDVSDLAPKLRAPALVIHRRGDRIVPFEYGRRIAALIPRARLATLEGDNHAFRLDGPETTDLTALLAEFMAEDLPGAGTAAARAENGT